MDTIFSADLLQMTFLGNTVKQWLIALGCGVFAYFALIVGKDVVAKNLKKLSDRTTTKLDDLIVGFVFSIHPLVILSISVYLISLMLDLPKGWTSFLSHIPVVLLILQTGFWGNKLLAFGLNAYAKSKTNEEDRLATETMVGPLRFMGLIIIWSLILLLVLDNIGFDVTTMITGLGIGGVAVALAVQNILGDLLAALSIVIDKPFVVGDFIIVGDYLGHVENIGLKTTRVRSLSGEQLIFSNSDLLGSRIRNYKRMFKRRVLFKFGVLYQTKPEQLRKIPVMTRAIIEGLDKTIFDRCHFAKFGDSSLDFEVVYFVDDPDYNLHMDIQEKINLELFEQFDAEGIDFAYPTRTLYINHENNSESTLTEVTPVPAS